MLGCVNRSLDQAAHMGIQRKGLMKSSVELRSNCAASREVNDPDERNADHSVPSTSPMTV